MTVFNEDVELNDAAILQVPGPDFRAVTAGLFLNGLRRLLTVSRGIAHRCARYDNPELERLEEEVIADRGGKVRLTEQFQPGTNNNVAEILDIQRIDD